MPTIPRRRTTIHTAIKINAYKRSCSSEFWLRKDGSCLPKALETPSSNDENTMPLPSLTHSLNNNNDNNGGPLSMLPRPSSTQSHPRSARRVSILHYPSMYSSLESLREHQQRQRQRPPTPTTHQRFASTQAQPPSHIHLHWLPRHMWLHPLSSLSISIMDEIRT